MKDQGQRHSSEALRSLIEKLYFFEIERRDKLNRKANFTIAFAAVYLSFLGFILNSNAFGRIDEVTTFLLLSVAGFTIFCWAFYRFFGHNVYYIADSSIIIECFSKAERYDSHPDTQGGELARLENDVLESCARSTDKNKAANHRKAALLLQCNQVLFLALCFAAISYIAGLAH